MTEHDRALVVLAFSDTGRRLLRHAGEHAAGCGVELILVTVMPTREFQDRDRARMAVPELDMPYTVGAAEAEGERHGSRLASEVLADLDVSYAVEAHVGSTASLILDVAAAHDCSAVFLTGHHRGPWQHTTFDEVLVEVVRTFDGPVTVLVGPELEA